MKKIRTSDFLATSIGIAVAIGVSLEDYAVGFGVGMTIFIVVNFFKRINHKKASN